MAAACTIRSAMAADQEFIGTMRFEAPLGLAPPCALIVDTGNPAMCLDERRGCRIGRTRHSSFMPRSGA